MNEEVRALNDALENLNTRKSKSRRILTGISSKNSETCKLISKIYALNFSKRGVRDTIKKNIKNSILSVICHQWYQKVIKW